MICPVCIESRVVEIELSLRDDSVRLRACSNCDTRWWEQDGERIDITDVLEMAAVRR